MINLEVAIKDNDWRIALELMRKVYVHGNYTPKEAADAFMSLENLQHAGELLIVRERTVILGTTLFLHPESPLKQLGRENEREFRLLAVAEEARGKGVGELLVRTCMDRAHAAGADALVLWTQPTMHSAQRIYERLGFTRRPERDVPDPRGWDRMVYAVELAGT